MDTQNNSQQPRQRIFIIGDEWLYYKFYTGAKTADVILTEAVKPAVEKFLSQGWIDKWFFIRYGDPKNHIRVRFHLVSPQFIMPVVQTMQSLCRSFVDQDLIWKVQIDTYQREIERYGLATMELAESLFFYESEMIVAMLDMLAGDEGEKYRWLFGIRTVDTFLDDFRFDMPQKLEFVTTFKESYGREFNINKGLREQLKTKYRAEQSLVQNVLDRGKDEESEMKPLFDLLAQRSVASAPIVGDILALQQAGKLTPPLNNLLGSYIHMTVNRIFKSKQRLHELVIYDFLWNYYKSEIARRKYNQPKNPGAEPKS